MEDGARLHPWFVTGLVDSAGSFTFSRNRANVAAYFALKLSAAEGPLLERLQHFFEAGKVYAVKSPPSAPSPTKAASYYRVTKLDGLQRIVDHFESFPLQSRKRDAYEIWKSLVILKRQSFRRAPLEELERLAARLSAAQPRRRA